MVSMRRQSEKTATRRRALYVMSSNSKERKQLLWPQYVPQRQLQRGQGAGQLLACNLPREVANGQEVGAGQLLGPGAKGAAPRPGSRTGEEAVAKAVDDGLVASG